jgi:hypothetical protein
MYSKIITSTFLAVVFILFVFSILLIINKNLREKFIIYDNPHHNYKNVPEFIKDYQVAADMTVVDPNYRFQNVTQYNFDRLFHKIKIINKEKINLKTKTNYNFYTQSTTREKLRIDLDMITKYVLLLLNKDEYYDFHKTNYGDVEVWVDESGNEEIKYELFLWDKKNYFEVKLLVNIVKFIEKEEMRHFGIRDKHYIFQDYYGGFPFKDQIIPLPEDINVSEKSATVPNGINPNNPGKIKHLYLNQIDIQNSTLIVDYEKDKYPGNKYEVTENGFSGITDTSLEYIKIIGDNNPFVDKARKYNKWPTLDEQPKWKGQFPSKPPPKHWDVDGVYFYSGKDKKPYSDKRLIPLYEPGTRWSEQKEDLQPYFWPTLATIPRNCGENFWLFDNSAGPVGGNTFIGGGKM